jgi:3-oxoacyl-[acyl-carrier protein] reductase
MKKLENKVAIVTGASKGIGAEIAKNLASEGASVVVNYSSDKDGADRVVNAIVANGGSAVAVQGNVSSRSDVEVIFARTKEAFGDADIVVNNAGVYTLGTLEQFNEDEFHRQFNTNVLGLLLVSQAAANAFGEKGGSIINIGSTVTRLLPPQSTIYAATKGAIDTITQVLSKELGPKKIRVNSINPGMTDTEGNRASGLIGSPFQAQFEAMTPLGRIGQPNDISPIAVFLASDDAKWVTGEVILAGGGMK